METFQNSRSTNSKIINKMSTCPTFSQFSDIDETSFDQKLFSKKPIFKHQKSKGIPECTYTSLVTQKIL